MLGAVAMSSPYCFLEQWFGGAERPPRWVGNFVVFSANKWTLFWQEKLRASYSEFPHSSPPPMFIALTCMLLGIHHHCDADMGTLLWATFYTHYVLTSPGSPRSSSSCPRYSLPSMLHVVLISPQSRVVLMLALSLPLRRCFMGKSGTARDV